MATAVGLVLLVAGVALAAEITCVAFQPCTGTPKADNITGTDNITSPFSTDDISALGGNDKVDGRGGDDLIQGGSGADELSGDGANDPPLDGNDSMYGQGGNDTIQGYGGSDTFVGGDDTIQASYLFETSSIDQVNGGRGNDTIQADDGFLDRITCGEGSKDRVTADLFDEVDNTCELVLKR